MRCVLDADAGALEHAKARAVEQEGHQPRRAVQLAEDCAHLLPGQHDGEPRCTLGADQPVEPGELLLEDVAREE